MISSYIAKYSNFNVPDWLKNGDIAQLPPALRPSGFQQYVKYLQGQGDYAQMQIVADSVLALIGREGRYSIPEIYLLLYSALGHLHTGRLTAAEERVHLAMRLALPDGIVLPFAENLTTLRGLIERCMKREYPEWLKPTQNKWASVFPHWVKLHNERLKHSVTLILTRREYQFALSAVNGFSNKAIAQQNGLAVDTVKEVFRSIYQKLNISSRQELRQVVL